LISFDFLWFGAGWILWFSFDFLWFPLVSFDFSLVWGWVDSMVFLWFPWFSFGLFGFQGRNKGKHIQGKNTPTKESLRRL